MSILTDPRTSPTPQRGDGAGAAADGGPPLLRLPEPGRLFDARAARFAALAVGHAAPAWLTLLSRIAGGQARAVREVRCAAPAPRPGRPLAYGELPRDAAWRGMLAVILEASRARGLPAPTEDALRRLGRADEGELEALADAVLSGAVPADRLACAPFVGAALQAWLAVLAARAEATATPEGACPVCGGPPLAARIRAGDRLRDVSCAVCGTEWNVPRVRCVSCETSAGPEYFEVDAEPGAKVEACPTCRTYLKLFDEEKRPGAEPTADDAATLALDLRLAEEGFHRPGPNLYVGTSAG